MYRHAHAHNTHSPMGRSIPSPLTFVCACEHSALFAVPRFFAPPIGQIRYEPCTHYTCVTYVVVPVSAYVSTKISGYNGRVFFPLGIFRSARTPFENRLRSAFIVYVCVRVSSAQCCCCIAIFYSFVRPSVIINRSAKYMFFSMCVCVSFVSVLSLFAFRIVCESEE